MVFIYNPSVHKLLNFFLFSIPDALLPLAEVQHRRLHHFPNSMVGANEK